MTTGKRLTEFGKRRPTPLPPVPGPKRSSHVALLVMGTLAVGGGAYALMPHETCQPAAPGVAAPGVVAPGVVAPGVVASGVAQPATPTTCTTRTSSGGGGGSSGYSRSRWSFFGGSSSSGSSSAGSTSSGMAESSSHVTRGGFGSFGRAFAFSGS